MLSAKCRYLPLVLLLHHLQLTYHVSTATVSSLPWLPTLRGKTGNTLASRGRLLAHVVEEGGDYECQDGSPPVPGNANSYNYQYGIIRSEELTVEEAATTCKTIPKCMGFSVDIPPEDLVGCYTWCDTVKHTIQFRWRLQDISTDTFHSDTIATTCLLKKEARPFTSANDYDTIQLSGWRFEVHKDNTKNIPFTHGPNTKIIDALEADVRFIQALNIPGIASVLGSNPASKYNVDYLADDIREEVRSGTNSADGNKPWCSSLSPSSTSPCSFVGATQTTMAAYFRIWVDANTESVSQPTYIAKPASLEAPLQNPDRLLSIVIPGNKYLEQRKSQPHLLLKVFAQAYADFHGLRPSATYLASKDNAVYSNMCTTRQRQFVVSDAKTYQTETYQTTGLPAAATVNSHEYFGELTESFFGSNDFSPHNARELKRDDPAGYEYVKNSWDVSSAKWSEFESTNPPHLADMKAVWLNGDPLRIAYRTPTGAGTVSPCASNDVVCRSKRYDIATNMTFVNKCAPAFAAAVNVYVIDSMGVENLLVQCTNVAPGARCHVGTTATTAFTVRTTDGCEVTSIRARRHKAEYHVCGDAQVPLVPTSVHVQFYSSTEAPFYKFYSGAERTNDQEIKVSTMVLKQNIEYTFHLAGTEGTDHPFYISDAGAGQTSTAKLTLGGAGTPSAGVSGGESMTVTMTTSTNVMYFCTAHASTMAGYFGLSSSLSGKVIENNLALDSPCINTFWSRGLTECYQCIPPSSDPVGFALSAQCTANGNTPTKVSNWNCPLNENPGLRCDRDGGYVHGAPIVWCQADNDPMIITGCTLPQCTIDPSIMTGVQVDVGQCLGERTAADCSINCPINYVTNPTVACVTDGGAFDVGECVKTTCTAPTAIGSMPAGYILDACGGTRSASDCKISCDVDQGWYSPAHYGGTPTATCATAGGIFSFSGCERKRCMSPMNPSDLYDVSQCQGTSMLPGDDCTVECSTRGTATATCVTAGEPFLLGGDCELYKCNPQVFMTIKEQAHRDKISYMYDAATGCGGVELVNINQCSVKCAAGHVGTPVLVCGKKEATSTSRFFNVTGCNLPEKPIIQCKVPSDDKTTGFDLSKCGGKAGAQYDGDSCLLSCIVETQATEEPVSFCLTHEQEFTFQGVCDQVKVISQVSKEEMTKATKAMEGTNVWYTHEMSVTGFSKELSETKQTEFVQGYVASGPTDVSLMSGYIINIVHSNKYAHITFVVGVNSEETLEEPVKEWMTKLQKSSVSRSKLSISLATSVSATNLFVVSASLPVRHAAADDPSTTLKDGGDGNDSGEQMWLIVYVGGGSLLVVVGIFCLWFYCCRKNSGIDMTKGSEVTGLQMNQLEMFHKEQLLVKEAEEMCERGEITKVQLLEIKKKSEARLLLHAEELAKKVTFTTSNEAKNDDESSSDEEVEAEAEEED